VSTSLLYLVPAFAVLIGFIWLDAVPLVGELLGGVVVIAGVVLVSLGDRTLARVRRAGASPDVTAPPAPEAPRQPLRPTADDANECDMPGTTTDLMQFRLRRTASEQRAADRAPSVVDDDGPRRRRVRVSR
jgi:hypothetical protein